VKITEVNVQSSILIYEKLKKSKLKKYKIANTQILTDMFLFTSVASTMFPHAFLSPQSKLINYELNEYLDVEQQNAA